MHTDQSRWLEGQARGQQGGCGARQGARGAGGEARSGWTPAWPSSHLDCCVGALGFLSFKVVLK